MRKEILKSKMMLIALASILFVSCGGGGGGGGGGSSNLPINPSKPTPSRPVETDPAYKFPTTSNPLDSRKGDMSALKTSLYNDQVASGTSIPKDTRETNGFVAGVNEGKLEGSGVKVAILDANFQDAVCRALTQGFDTPHIRPDVQPDIVPSGEEEQNTPSLLEENP